MYQCTKKGVYGKIHTFSRLQKLTPNPGNIHSPANPRTIDRGQQASIAACKMISEILEIWAMPSLLDAEFAQVTDPFSLSIESTKKVDSIKKEIVQYLRECNLKWTGQLSIFKVTDGTAVKLAPGLHIVDVIEGNSDENPFVFSVKDVLPSKPYKICFICRLFCCIYFSSSRCS
jgi:hypothetical protein